VDAKVDPLDVAAATIPRVLRDRAVFPVFQPIMELATGDVVGVEALARGPAGSAVEYPSTLFAAASRAGLLPQVDQLCFTRAVEIARDAAELVPSLLFANAEPAVVNEPISPDLLAAVRSEKRFRIVMEYTERALASHLSSLLGLASLAYEDGNAIAMDDVGVEPMSLALLPVLEPDVVKLDMQLLRHPHLSSSVETAAIVASYAERTGAMVVAEGIETEDDLATARVLGAQWGQGWLFGQPGPLTALAGRPVQNTPRLRPPRPGGYLPPGTLFDIAAMGNRSRPCDRRTIDELTEYLLSVAGSSGSRTVILGVYPDQAVGEAWLPRLTAMADTVAFVGLTGARLPGRNAHRLSVAMDPANGTETALAVIGPYAAVALCARPAPGGGMEVVLTHEANRVHVIARMLMRLVGAAADAWDSAATPSGHGNRDG
jgi:EAL domain-containing protein (putative c-di-GMP-specific phosphodiesterase class I)